MADFDLTQTDAQVQSILNDGQNMQGAGAQTTLTTESVLLKDVNGNYHKILKSSFTEAIRDTLAGLLVNNDKGTTINQIAAIASGDFGSITPANLASVLGVGIPRVRALRNVGLGYIVFSVDNSYAPKEIKILFNRYGVDCVITIAWGRNESLANYSIISSRKEVTLQGGLEIFCSQTQMAIHVTTGDSWAVAEGVSYYAGMTVNQYESYDTTGMTQIL